MDYCLLRIAWHPTPMPPKVRKPVGLLAPDCDYHSKLPNGFSNPSACL
jgi:hypothetical protein